jgi:hypothetical protein
MALAGGLGAAGQIANGIIGSNAAGNAAQTAAQGTLGALETGLAGTQAGLNALDPYYGGGLTDYDILQSLMTGQGPSYSTPALQGIGGVNLPAGATPQQVASAISALQQGIAGWEGGSNVSAQEKYAGTLGEMQSELAQLQQIQQQQNAATQAGTATNQLAAQGMGPGWLTNIPQFSYNVNNDPNLQSAATWANNLIASQNAAAGGYGSGNMASALNQEDVGTLEPAYYNQAFQNYDVNQIQPRQMIYNMLTGNTSGAGGAMAQNAANLNTGSAANAGQYLTGIGNDLASGTLGQANAFENSLTGLGTQANSLLGLGMNYQNAQSIAQAIAAGQIPTQTFGGTYGAGSGINALQSPLGGNSGYSIYDSFGSLG